MKCQFCGGLLIKDKRDGRYKCTVCKEEPRGRRGCDYNYEGYHPPGCNEKCNGYCIAKCNDNNEE
jgi:hypothetical protein